MLKKLGLINLRKDTGRGGPVLYHKCIVSLSMHLPQSIHTSIVELYQQQTQQLTLSSNSSDTATRVRSLIQLTEMWLDNVGAFVVCEVQFNS